MGGWLFALRMEVLEVEGGRFVKRSGTYQIDTGPTQYIKDLIPNSPGYMDYSPSYRRCPYIIMDRLCPSKLIYYSKWRVFHNVYLPRYGFGTRRNTSGHVGHLCSRLHTCTIRGNVGLASQRIHIFLNDTGPSYVEYWGKEFSRIRTFLRFLRISNRKTDIRENNFGLLQSKIKYNKIQNLIYNLIIISILMNIINLSCESFIIHKYPNNVS